MRLLDRHFDTDSARNRRGFLKYTIIQSSRHVFRIKKLSHKYLYISNLRTSIYPWSHHSCNRQSKPHWLHKNILDLTILNWVGQVYPQWQRIVFHVERIHPRYIHLRTVMRFSSILDWKSTEALNSLTEQPPVRGVDSDSAYEHLTSYNRVIDR